MHVIYIAQARYLWDEETKKLTLNGELVAFAANPSRARDIAALHGRRHDADQPIACEDQATRPGRNLPLFDSHPEWLEISR